MSYETILYEVKAGVAWVTLNRPDKLNAVTAQMIGELIAAFDAAEADKDVRVLLLTGAGRAFCPGQDLNDRVSSNDGSRPDLGQTVENNWNPLMRKLYNLSLPTVAAVNGVAAGAGANLALACDIVIAHEAAKFVQVYANLGLVPDAGGSFILPKLVGLAKAKELCLTARPVMAAEAEAMGMIAHAKASDDFMPFVEELVARMATQPTFGLTQTKRILNASYANDLDAQLDLERDTIQKCGFSDDYAEGVKAFMEKRKPEFKGR